MSDKVIKNIDEIENNKAILASVCLNNEDYDNKLASLDELERLADTAGIVSVKKIIQKRRSLNPKTYSGKGFLEDVCKIAEELDANLLIFDSELSPRQGINIAEITKLRVIDRTEVILDIFNSHAKTNEAKLQVQKASLEYQMPRLTRLWSHFSGERVAASSGSSGGGTASRGMGETQLEVDKRIIRKKLKQISDKLHEIMLQKKTQSKQRTKMKRVCLVGYTNAGKSTLFNQITKAGVLAENKLFATLDSTVRTINFGLSRDALLSDTVGFISQLPHHLVASFRATLMEVTEADLLLHVVDCSDPRHSFYINEVDKVLDSIDCKNIDTLLIFNKIDLMDEEILEKVKSTYPKAIFISAKNEDDMEGLFEQIIEELYKITAYEVFVPYNDFAITSKVEELGSIVEKTAEDTGIRYKVEIAQRDLHLFSKYIVE